MDEKYTISEKYRIENDILISGGSLCIPAAEGFAFTQILCSSAKADFILDAEIENVRGEIPYYAVDFGKIRNDFELLISQLIEAGEGSCSFSVFFLDGLNCHRVQDIRKNNILVYELSCFKRDGLDIVLGAYFQPDGSLSLLLTERERLYGKNINVYLSMAKQEKNICSITCTSRSLFNLKEAGGECLRFELRKMPEDKKHVVPIKECHVNGEDDKKELEISGDINFKEIEGLFLNHWNLYLIFGLAGHEYRVSIFHKKGNRKLGNEIQKNSLLNGYKNPNGINSAYLYITGAGRVKVFTGDLNSLLEYGEGLSFKELIRNMEVPFVRELSAQILEAGMGYMKIQLMEASLEEADDAALLVYKMAGVHILIVPVEITDRSQGIFKVSTVEFSKICKSSRSEAFKFAIAIRCGNRFLKGRLYDKRVYVDTMISRYGTLEEEAAAHEEEKDDMQEERSVYLDNIFTANVDGETVEACPYISSTGFFMMRMCSSKNMSVYKIVCEALKVQVSDSFLEIRAKCPDWNRNWDGFLLSYAYQKEEDKDNRYFKADSSERKGDFCILSARIPLKDQEFKGIYWYIRPAFKSGDDLCYASIKALTLEEKESYKKLSQRNGKYYNVGDEKYILFPFVASNDNISLMYRKSEGNDGIKFRIKERLGLHLFQLFEKRLKAKKIMLIYEKYCYMAQDNAYQLFKYCMENNMEEFLNRKIYYVIDKKSPDYANVKKYHKNVLDFMSVKFIAYILASKLLVSSDVRSHAYAFRHRSSIISHVIQKKKHIFLQHGVTAMKKVDNIFGKASNCTNLFVVTSDDEYNIVSRYFGYNKNEIALTGFARWDVLEDKSEGRREILLMPTWRNWLDDVDSETFKKSDYYRNYMELLNSSRLHDILEKNDVRMNFYIHPKFKDYIGSFKIKGDRIRLIPFGTEPLNELMMQCSLLITDYSSVSWDVYYMKKPVLFYQFDIDMYNRTHGSYIDMEHDLFGDRTLDLNELIGLIEENIKNGFRLKPKYEKECSKNFKYMDKDNCKRICMVIKQKGF